MIDRRNLIAAGAALVAAPALASPRPGLRRAFPKAFLWGAATAGHQVEGNNTNSDTWFLETLPNSSYAELSGDAANSFELWSNDMDLAKRMGLNSYRFSLEWARIEPSPNHFSGVMLDHYKRMVEGCHARGLLPIVTFNHFTSPAWFSAQGGWLSAAAPELFARYCDKTARHFADGIGYALTLNEPNIMRVLVALDLPPKVWATQRTMLAEAARQSDIPRYVTINAANAEDVEPMQRVLMKAHAKGRAAIKAVRPTLPVGFSLALGDDQAVGLNSMRDEKRRQLYGGWLELAREDDFVGVQNYARTVWTDKGKAPTPPGGDRNMLGSEVYAPSLAGAVRYAYEETKRPVLISEHGVGTSDDAVRARFIPAALAELKKVMDSGVPVLGYVHWSLIDNFEWVFGYRYKFGLHAVDPVTFRRTPKPSALVLSQIAQANAI